ncbi:MOSC domain-containing protein [Salinithrix halophila]|uniref:MOSC domain-containing protein n=1 Tax=Salinithrix halophila TaxID=1485204 RepID=A0ABV8JJH9_9BACL
MNWQSKPFIRSIQVGRPRAYRTPDRTWRSGICKERVAGPLRLEKTNLEGDGQADLKNHGGPDKAVLAYSESHYPRWQKELNRMDLTSGGFGENFSVVGLTEADVCIGDTFRVGEAIIQVSQTRIPCWKLDARWGIGNLAARVRETGRSGWYYRVLQEGIVEENQPLIWMERPYPEWTVAKVNELLHHCKDDREAVRRLAACPALADSMRNMMVRRGER